MTFILSAVLDRDDPEELRKRFDKYYAYLELVRNRMPRSAYEFAVAPWRYDSTDPRCPHDAWLEELKVSEPSSGERLEIREILVTLRLLGAYHDGYITLEYVNVWEYSLTSPPRGQALPARAGHGDWLVDEITLDDDGRVCHEIESSSGSRWIIVAEDIRYQWHDGTN